LVGGNTIGMLDNEDRQWLQDVFGNRVRFDAIIAAYTSLRIGGPADALVEPASLRELGKVVQRCRQKQIPYLVMGGGTNLLVADAGLRGVTLRLSQMADPLRWVTDRQGRIRVTAAAGLPTKRLCGLALQRGWQGMNFAIGIPGLLGGAIAMNAGTATGQMDSVIAALTVLTVKGDVMRLEKNDLLWRYRRLQLPGEGAEDGGQAPIVVEAEINLTPGDGVALRNEARRVMQRRVRTQPIGKLSAGSFFKNPTPIAPAGRLIDEAGLKGVSVGDAQVSRRHANFIINRGRATADDVLSLKTLIEETVWRRFGIRLQPEVRIVGQF
jgi:UDP-N-acetylmuramate dehydrogenase